MTRAIKAALAVAMSLATASGVLAQEPAYNRDIRDLKPTILDLKGLSSDANSASLDLNAQVAGLAAQHSGLSVRQDKTALRVSMLGDVLFDFDKASIQPSAEPTLQDILRLITSIPSGTVAIEGHTDSKGSASYNRDLSVRRANAVADWLTAHGAKKSRLSVKGFGGSRPVASNTLKNGADNPDGRKLNRRVEFVLPNAAGAQ
ncbi:MAG: OmpA family protein [Burkholderia sp.]|jgi:outer membrane protein OmpA-like peptidoglycan-associated protein|uniref:OmpA family protein n=1 Tax=Burkholderia TaxID=32008 RepID=UPI001CA3C203|nr:MULTISPECIES: OmpA family protein [Burkholderia]MBY8603721.1 OmpA family protein [Burkholderia arboris]MCA3777456.1 OmpA family protein [Burkholderia sp.]MCA3790059.1 OmpA family protein [Burkholderia sp.]MCA3792399.1 OmpA family protein [Burkholderia sp.]MCA3803123.1 OmpA family protein [Burkholderia sp.]